MLCTLSTNVVDAEFLRASFYYRVMARMICMGNGLRVVVFEATTKLSKAFFAKRKAVPLFAYINPPGVSLNRFELKKKTQ